MKKAASAAFFFAADTCPAAPADPATDARSAPTRDLATADTLSPAGPYRSLKQVGLVLLCVAWVLLGLVGHDPWKTEDAGSFGVAWEMMKSGAVVAPTLAGEPYRRQPAARLRAGGGVRAGLRRRAAARTTPRASPSRCSWR